MKYLILLVFLAGCEQTESDRIEWGYQYKNNPYHNFRFDENPANTRRELRRYPHLEYAHQKPIKQADCKILWEKFKTSMPGQGFDRICPMPVELCAIKIKIYKEREAKRTRHVSTFWHPPDCDLAISKEYWEFKENDL